MLKKASRIVQVLSPNDRQLVGLVKDVLELEIVESVSVDLAPGYAIEVGSASELSELLADAPSDRYIHAIHIVGNDKAGQSGHQVYRSAADFSRTVTDGETEVASVTLAEVYFRSTQNNGRPTQEFVGEIYPLVLKHLSRDIPELDPAKDVGAFGVAISQMAAASAKITETLAEARIEQEARTQKALEEISEQHKEQQEGIRKFREEQEQLLNQRSKDLDEREASLENDSAKSEQRKLRNTITNDVKSALQDNLPDKRSALDFVLVWIVTLVAVALLFYFAFESFNKAADLVAKQAEFSWGQAALLVRATLSFIASFVLLFWLLQFLRSRIESSRLRQIRLERYALDVERGSWIVETLLATRDEEGVPDLPQAWLDGATRNLFTDASPSKEKRETDPLIALGNLLSTGASLKLGDGTNQLSLNSSASRKTAKRSDVD